MPGIDPGLDPHLPRPPRRLGDGRALGSDHAPGWWVIPTWLWPDGAGRAVAKPPADVVAAAFDSGPTLGERPEGLYLNWRGAEGDGRRGKGSQEAEMPIPWEDTLKYIGTRLQKKRDHSRQLDVIYTPEAPRGFTSKTVFRIELSQEEPKSSPFHVFIIHHIAVK